MSTIKTYSQAEKKAYYSGMGYRAAFEGKAIPFKNADNRASFKSGFNKAKKTVARYPKLAKKKPSGNSKKGGYKK